MAIVSKRKQPKDTSTAVPVRNWRQVTRNKKVERFEDNVAEILKFDTTPAIVKAGLSRTINLGNYQSVQVSVGVELPCYVEEIRAAQEAALVLCQDAIEPLVEEVTGSTPVKNESKGAVAGMRTSKKRG